MGIVRVSGPLSRDIARQATGIELKERHAHFCSAITKNKQEIDQGIALFFKGPNSFTGEDVFEFQGHGGPVVLDLIVKRFIELGATLAKPGEFSERAFLNDKIDLTQAEAIADLINASSVQAAQNALHSLKGEFAQHIDKLVEELTHLRLYVESAIDFPEEEIDFLNDGVVTEKLKTIIEQTLRVFKQSEQGSLLREGMKVVLAGKPNAGKSTLLNALAERDVAIVTDIEGTTRDALTEHIHINGMPLHI
ncbi:MAG: tRNA modification GTPase, partial [Acidiferrobacterales bacterium]|nr:tRNA modification GTPase [Acidiferrobacterales bacterium]